MISCEECCYTVVKQICEHTAAYHNTAWLLTGGKMSRRVHFVKQKFHTFNL